jgi:hypothetical protein
MTDLPTVTIDAVNVQGRELPILSAKEVAGPTAEFRKEFMELLERHRGEDPREHLAIAAHALGRIVTTQDSQTMTQARANAIISYNLKMGQIAVLREKGLMPEAVQPSGAVEQEQTA